MSATILDSTAAVQVEIKVNDRPTMGSASVIAAYVAKYPGRVWLAMQVDGSHNTRAVHGAREKDGRVEVRVRRWDRQEPLVIVDPLTDKALHWHVYEPEEGQLVYAR